MALYVLTKAKRKIFGAERGLFCRMKNSQLTKATAPGRNKGASKTGKEELKVFVFILSILTAILVSLTALSGWVFHNRLNMPFNEEGRYPAENGVVYHEQSKEFYGLTTFLLSLLTMLIAWVLMKTINQLRVTHSV